jgi:long-chain acyl-CoA synthetase
METALGNHPIVSKAAMIGDRRKFLTMVIALDAEEAPRWAEANGIEFLDLARFSAHEQVLAEVSRAVEEANTRVARVEQVKKWIVVPDEWSPESGELTPSLKLKRNVVLDRYAGEIEELYAGV